MNNQPSRAIIIDIQPSRAIIIKNQLSRAFIIDNQPSGLLLLTINQADYFYYAQRLQINWHLLCLLHSWNVIK
jgi:hypothetical protein